MLLDAFSCPQRCSNQRYMPRLPLVFKRLHEWGWRFIYGVGASRMMSSLCNPAASDNLMPVSLIMASDQRISSSALAQACCNLISLPGAAWWTWDAISYVGLLESLADFTIYQMIKTHLVCHYQQYLWHQESKPICCNARYANVTVSRWLLGRSSWPNNHSHPFPLCRPYKA